MEQVHGPYDSGVRVMLNAKESVLEHSATEALYGYINIFLSSRRYTTITYTNRKLPGRIYKSVQAVLRTSGHLFKRGPPRNQLYIAASSDDAG